jgi:hypothetical protein
MMSLRACWLAVTILGLIFVARTSAADNEKPPAPKNPANDVPKLSGQTLKGKLARRFPTKQELDDAKKVFEGDIDPQNIGETIKARMEAFRQRLEKTLGLQVEGQFLPMQLQFADNMEVRWAQPPAQFDNKGKPIKPTPKMLKDLKGPDPKKVGYTAALEDLREGQLVVVYLVAAPKPAATPKPAAPKTKPPARVPQMPEAPPKVGMILIVQESSSR